MQTFALYFSFFNFAFNFYQVTILEKYFLPCIRFIIKAFHD
jgi:hypothetical protein